SNLDEFYMVRVAGLRRQIIASVTQAPPDGLTSAEQLAAIRREVAVLVKRQRACLAQLLAELADQGIRIIDIPDLHPQEWGEIVGWYPFRITRFSDLEMPVDEPEDLLAMIEEQVFKRRFGEVVRVEVEDAMPVHIRALLLDELREDDASVPGGLSANDFHEAG